MTQPALLAALVTTVGTIFVAELTDKDALFLLALSTKTKPAVVFAAGSVAFVMTSAVIVAAGSLLIRLVPVFAIRLAGGAIMLAYAGLELSRLSRDARDADEREERLLRRPAPSPWSVFAPAVLTLVLLDLSGDATEVLTVVLLARFQDALLVFAGAVVGLVAAVGVETALGNRLARVLSPRRLRVLSVVVFLAIGSAVIATTLGA
ncbi:MAG: TMEM165/GDT1 family protein [Nitrososphaerota archaeon]|nr:TMEM165/GDT1 family protein [Nitrososphaerota archaeon]MDG7005371.1 TMEM165/GDT1 family protein [Nitrososphaerota archaeon]